MAEHIPKIVAGLAELTHVADVWAEIDDRIARGDAAFAADLGIAAFETYGSESNMWQYTAVLDHVLRRLSATAGLENVVQTLRLVAAIDRATLDRHVASLLASGQDTRNLTVAFTSPAPEELRACLVHELVLRGVDVERMPGIAEWATSPHWRGHPLGRLPLTPSEMEAGADLPVHGDHGRNHTTPFGPPEVSASTETVAEARVPPARETTAPDTAAAMTRAVASWVEESNGRVEARVFELAEPVEVVAVAQVLPTLGLDCLRGAGTDTAVSVAAGPPARAWRSLFVAAAGGGAYTFGSGGAYGRLAAWRSMVALAGCPEGAAVDEVRARVGECSWHVFGGDTPWFAQVAWDLGVIALGADRRRLAVLAATDSD
ncbi:DUF6183 family protein [Embleya hyalina]|uniref:Uncharacterized protein n=1 Tax=Embleya hyalina TaxID=516124 RepID=A0A401YQL9_9ACTN|nr:DUF6183 family protein [Embleya hyalina]GCD96892.1 hypothetical protein EHYA_04579 [Embleya hyalina]